MPFTTEYREQVRNLVLLYAKIDHRIVSAATIGSYAKGTNDQWSDIDLTFGVQENYSTSEVLQNWTEYISKEFKGVDLLDVSKGNTIYRVFILPGNLQMDLSFSPEKEFGAFNKDFILLYGKQYEKPLPDSLSENVLLGWIVHHLIRIRYSLKRGRLWQAEFWLSEARDYMLKIACMKRGLNPDHGRGFDDLPKEVLTVARDCFAKNLSALEIEIAAKKIIQVLPDLTINSEFWMGKYSEIRIELLRDY